MPGRLFWAEKRSGFHQNRPKRHGKSTGTRRKPMKQGKSIPDRMSPDFSVDCRCFSVGTDPYDSTWVAIIRLPGKQ